MLSPVDLHQIQRKLETERSIVTFYYQGITSLTTHTKNNESELEQLCQKLFRFEEQLLETCKDNFWLSQIELKCVDQRRTDRITRFTDFPFCLTEISLSQCSNRKGYISHIGEVRTRPETNDNQVDFNSICLQELTNQSILGNQNYKENKYDLDSSNKELKIDEDIFLEIVLYTDFCGSEGVLQICLPI